MSIPPLITAVLIFLIASSLSTYCEAFAFQAASSSSTSTRSTIQRNWKGVPHISNPFSSLSYSLQPSSSKSSSSSFSPSPFHSLNSHPSQSSLHAVIPSTPPPDANDPSTTKHFKRIQKILTIENEKHTKITSDLAKTQAKLRNLEELKASYLEGDDLAEVMVKKKTGLKEMIKETTQRSAIKSFLWRLIAGSVTFVTALKFSGSIATAINIVASDFISKSATMFIGERIFNKSQAGRTGESDTLSRSLSKALIWRVFALVNTLVASLFFMKGNVNVAGKIASSDAVIKTGMMFFYERMWAKIDWGKDYDVEFQI